MDHKLRIVVSLEFDTRCADIRVTGCLTDASCAALIPVIRRASLLGFCVNIDLTSSRHVEATALASLQDGRILAAVRARTMVQGSFINNFTVTAPLILPVCPALFPVEFTKSVHLTMRA